MDLETCSVCVLAGSMSGAAAGFYAGRPRRRRRARGRGSGRTGRSWPGSRAHPDGLDRGPGDGST
jgi:hypothetical protein